MRRLLFAAMIASVSTRAFSVADLFITQTNEFSQSTFSRQFAYTVGSQAAEAGSTNQIIVATAHAANIGDMIRFTTGVNYYLEGHVRGVTANTITIQRVLPVAPNPGDTFLIMRLITPSVASDGSAKISGAVTATNASIGPTGGPAPASATLVGGSDGVNLRALKVDSTGVLAVSSAPISHAFADSKRNDYTGTAVTTGAWVQMIASTAAAATALTLQDTSGQTLELGAGAPGFESRILLVPQGGIDGQFSLSIAAGTRLSLRAVSANAVAGEFDLTLFQ